jgi:hypothetical protein
MPTTTPTRGTYLLVCRDASNRLQMSPTEMGELLCEWLAWHDSLQAASRLRFCSPVETESCAVSKRLSSGHRFRPEEHAPVIGYLLIEADGLEDATEVAKGCPGLNRGFEIEVYRPFER